MLTYAPFPSSIFKQLHGDSLSKDILLTLILHRNTETNRTRFMSTPEISVISGVSRTSTYRSIDKLKNMCIIEEVAIRRNERMYYLPFLGGADTEGKPTEEDDQSDDRWGNFLRENNLEQS